MTIGVESDEEQTATMVQRLLKVTFNTDMVYVSYLDPRRSDDLFQLFKDFMSSGATDVNEFYGWVRRNKK
jgi:hypothetical protein